MIQAVAVDYGGVLVDLPSDPTRVARVADAVGVSPAALKAGVYGVGRALWNRTKVGEIPEAEHWAQAQEVLQLDAGTVAWIRRELFDAVTVRDRFVTYLRGLKGACKLALVSNAIPSFTETWRRLGLLDLFDVAINSSDVGVAKPDERIFRLALESLHVAASDCVLVDDQEENVRAAARLGFRVVQYGDSAQAIAEIQGLRGL